MDGITLLLLVPADRFLSTGGLSDGSVFLLRLSDDYGDGNRAQCGVLSHLSDFFSETGAAGWLLGELYETRLPWQLPGAELCTKPALFQLLPGDLCFHHMCGNESLDSDIYCFNCCYDRVVNDDNEAAYIRGCVDGGSTFSGKQDFGNFIDSPVFYTDFDVYWKIKSKCKKKVE